MNDKLIIHFTKRFDILREILSTNSLLLSYCKEDFNLGNKKISSAAHPMVCFSEYDIEGIDSEIITYGNYGIGFSKTWVKKHKISPVLYISDDSIAAKGLSSLLKARQNQESSKLPDNLRLPIMEIKCFTKNVCGYNSFLNDVNFDFKRENEWRYVPEKKDIGNGYISLDRSKYKKDQSYYNNKLKPYPLKFKLSEIEIIFVSNKYERNVIIQEFNIENDKIRIGKWRLS